MDPEGEAEDRLLVEEACDANDVFCAADGTWWGRASKNGNVAIFDFEGQVLRRHPIKISGELCASLGPGDAVLAGIDKKLFVYPASPRSIVTTRKGALGERGKFTQKAFDDVEAASIYVKKQQASLGKKELKLVGFRAPDDVDFTVARGDRLTATGPSGQEVEFRYLELSREAEPDCEVDRVESHLEVLVDQWKGIKKGGYKKLIQVHSHDAYDGEGQAVVEEVEVDKRLAKGLLDKLGTGLDEETVLSAVARATPYPDGLLLAIDSMDE